MKTLGKLGVAAAFTIATSVTAASAQQDISPAERDAALDALAQIIEDEFFDAERAARIARALRDAGEGGQFDSQETAEAFAAAVADAGWRVDELPVAFDRGRLLRAAPEVKEE